MKKIRSIRELASSLEQDEQLLAQVKSDPVSTLKAQFEIPDTKVYRYVIFFLGLTILFTVIGYFILAVTTAEELEPAIIALASGAVGALAGVLSINQN